MRLLMILAGAMLACSSGPTEPVLQPTGCDTTGELAAERDQWREIACRMATPDLPPGEFVVIAELPECGSLIVKPRTTWRYYRVEIVEVRRD